MQEGAVSPLVALCSNSQEALVIGHAAAALATLALTASVRPQMVQEGAVWPLVQLCAKSKDERVLESCTAALANLSLDDEGRGKVRACTMTH
jgi:hypothetical protein